MLSHLRPAVSGAASQIRALATGAAAPKDAKPRVRAPSSIPGKAGKRAGEMWEEAYAAEGDAGVGRLEKELAVLVWSVKADRRWDIETTTPFFPLEWKRQQVAARVKALGLSPLLATAVTRLVEAGEIRRLGQVRLDFEELMRAHRREVDVQLVTARPLSAEHRAQVQKAIQADYLRPGDNLIFSASVDAGLGGGYKVVIKGQEHDHSWARDLAATRAAARAAYRARPAEAAFSGLPRPPALGLGGAVQEMKQDKELGAVFGPALFARTLTHLGAEETAIQAALAAPAPAL